MHFAYPPRKSSNPPPFRPARPSSSRLPALRRRTKRTALAVVGAILFLLYLFSGSPSSTPYHEHPPSGSPPVVIVTVVDTSEYHAAYLDTIKMNRELYAKKHGMSWLVCAERQRLMTQATRQ